MDPRFGRAECFLFYDSDSKETEILDNSNAANPSGVGVASAQLMVDRGVDTVIAAKVGPKAGGVLQAAGITVSTGVDETLPASALIEKIVSGEI
jgi:predicted Fe-Mo cluster-binding NifX family protein